MRDVACRVHPTSTAKDPNVTDLYVVSLDAVEDATFRGRVHLINPDATLIPDISSFFVQLLLEAWHRLSNGYWFDHPDPSRADRHPFSPEQAHQIPANMRLKDEFQKLQNLFFGEIRVDENGYLLADDGRTVLDPPRKAEEVYEVWDDSQMDEISRYVRAKPDPDAIYRRSDEIVTHFHISPVHNIPSWAELAAVEDEEDPLAPEERETMAAWEGLADMDYTRAWTVIRNRAFEDRPYADITVTVSDPGYLGHLAAGMRWSSTAHGYF